MVCMRTNVLLRSPEIRLLENTVVLKEQPVISLLENTQYAVVTLQIAMTMRSLKSAKHAFYPLQNLKDFPASIAHLTQCQEFLLSSRSVLVS